MKEIFFGTSNQGKQDEIRNFMEIHGTRDISLRFPTGAQVIDVEETGITYLENAKLKADAYRSHIGNENYLYIGDDSGLSIPALNNEPGVYSKRWAGYYMKDEEILSFCLNKMSGLEGEDRIAYFVTTIVAMKSSGEFEEYTGKLKGRILDEPLEDVPLNGFPLRQVFFIDELGLVWDDAVKLSMEERGGFKTNREEAFIKLFDSLD